MGTLNLLSEVLNGQPIFANFCLNLIIHATFSILLLGLAKYLHANNSTNN